MGYITYKWVQVDNPEYPTFHAYMPECTLSVSEYPHGWCWGAFEKADKGGNRLVPQDLCEVDKKSALSAVSEWYGNYLKVLYPNG